MLDEYDSSAQSSEEKNKKAEKEMKTATVLGQMFDLGKAKETKKATKTILQNIRSFLWYEFEIYEKQI